MPASTSSSRFNPLAITGLTILATLLGCGGVAGYFLRQQHEDHKLAAALSEALTAPRAIFDGRTLETRYNLAVEDLAADRHTSPAKIAVALNRYASDDLFGGRRSAYDAYLGQLASRRFEIAIATIRELGTAAKNETTPLRGQPAWQLLTMAGVLEFSRGRATAAIPPLQQAFDLANEADQLETPAAASLLTALGAIELSRSRPAEAEPYLRRAAAVLRKAPGADPRDRARALTHFARSLVQQGFPEEAEPVSSEALSLAAEFRRNAGRPDADQAIFEENYRQVLRQRGLADAEINARVEEVR